MFCAVLGSRKSIPFKEMLALKWYLYAVSASLFIPFSLASLGDRHVEFIKCMNNCTKENCTTDADIARFRAGQKLAHKLTFWSCEDECKYTCMWHTVDWFVNQSFTIPQFYGKWPFYRFLGMQEPASVLFSILNQIGFIYMLSRIATTVPFNCPMRFMWLVYSTLGIFTWFWSAVFHTRDTGLTEKMDYFCAFSCIMCSFYACILRLLGTDSFWKIILPAAPLATYMVYHVYYLAFVRFDYGYNMTATVSIGLANSVFWLSWCAYQRLKNGHRYVGYCAAVVILANIFVLLELNDFPPFFWTFDAHSLWHCLTIPLPVLWTRWLRPKLNFGSLIDIDPSCFVLVKVEYFHSSLLKHIARMPRIFTESSLP